MTTALFPLSVFSVPLLFVNLSRFRLLKNNGVTFVIRFFICRSLLFHGSSPLRFALHLNHHNQIPELVVGFPLRVPFSTPPF